jgi:hypothetical protein
MKGSRENKEADNYVTLAFALLRTDALTEALSRSATTIDPDPDRSERLMWEELRTQSLGNTGRYISFLTLYFASIDTVIRVWTRAKFVNPVVAECLENKRMRQMLTDFRNDLLRRASNQRRSFDGRQHTGRDDRVGKAADLCLSRAR